MDYEFADLVDIYEFQGLFDSIYEVTGIAAGIASVDGTFLTKTGEFDLCTKFHRANPCIAGMCVESIKASAKAIEKDEEYRYYKCENGIMHAITPIYIKDKCVAVIYKSQFFLSAPDLEYFRNQAKRSLG